MFPIGHDQHRRIESGEVKIPVYLIMSLRMATCLLILPLTARYLSHRLPSGKLQKKLRLCNNELQIVMGCLEGTDLDRVVRPPTRGGRGVG